MVLIHAPVGKDQDIRTISVSSVCFHKQAVNRFLKACVLIINDRDHFHFEAFHLHVFDFHQIGVCKDRVVHFEHLTVDRLLL